MKYTIQLLILLFFPLSLIQAQLNGKMKIYFTHPVNTSFSTGVDAIYLNNSMDDTLVAYINRAKYTIDIAVYNYQQSSGMADIAAAINNAEANGVVVRWIYDSNQSNSGMSALNPTIHTFGSPTSNGTYEIMHNKFMIIDANSANPNDPIIWTGSTNWTKTHFNSNVNNTIIIQDKNLALAFLTEFNEMWGDSGTVPNLSNSKFGPDKTDNTPHNFTIEGTSIELFFSPSDATNTQVLNAINSATTDLYFGMLTFSLSSNSSALINQKNNGVYAAGIIDQTSQFYTPYSQLSSSLGSDLQVYSQLTSVYHNKLLLVDPCSNLSDPMVLTGSYNWSNPASTQNDENLLIIHDDTVANIFYQSFYQNFSDLGAVLSPCSTTFIDELNNKSKYVIYPNPTNQFATLEFENQNRENCTLILYNAFGQIVKVINTIKEDSVVIERDNLPNGLYFYQLSNSSHLFIRGKLVFTDFK